MQLLNEKHLFGIIPQQQIRFSQDSLTVWEGFCGCPDFCSAIEITTLTSALCNALLKENTKKYSDLLQTYRIYHPSMIYITYFPSKFLNSTWNKLQDWTFWLFFLPSTFKQCPFQTLTVSDSSQHSGNFFQRNNSHYTKKWKQWKSDKDNNCNHVTYFLALASLVHSF